MRLGNLLDKEPSVMKNALKLLAFFILSVFLLIVTINCSSMLFPFIVALIFTMILDKPLKFLKVRLHISRPLGAAICIGLITAIACLLLIILVINLYVQAKGLVIQLPRMYNDFIHIVERLFDTIETQYDFVTPEVLEELESMFARFRSTVLSLVNNITKGVWNTAISAPQVFISIVITMLSSFFMLRDKDRLKTYFNEQLPDHWISAIIKVRHDLWVSLFGYLKAICFLSFLSFVELFIGFSILGIEYGAVIALLCAILDALPAIGTGWVLTPWGIIAILTGSVRTGVSLLILYVIVFAVRQVLEPRIVGKRIGMYQLLLLMAMFLGMRYFGVIGLLAGPLSAIVLRSLMRLYFNGRTLHEVLMSGIEETAPETTEDAQAAESVVPTESDPDKSVLMEDKK